MSFTRWAGQQSWLHKEQVIAGAARRSQYDFIDGYARHMRDALPHASFIGVTGTPIELKRRNGRHLAAEGSLYPRECYG